MIARTYCQVTSRPKVPAPELPTQQRKFLQQYPRTHSFEPLDDLADLLRRPVADEHVYVIRCNLAGNDVQLMLKGNLAQQVSCPYRHLSGQNRFPVLGYPDQMNLQVRPGMRSNPVTSHGDILKSSLRLKASDFNHP